MSIHNGTDDDQNRREAIEGWISRSSDSQKAAKEVEYLLKLSPELPAMIADSGALMKPVNITYKDKTWAFLVLCTSSFSASGTFEKMPSVRFYPVSPSISQIKQHIRLTPPDIKIDDSGNEYIVCERLRNVMANAYNMLAGSSLLVENAHKSVQRWIDKMFRQYDLDSSLFPNTQLPLKKDYTFAQIKPSNGLWRIQYSDGTRVNGHNLKKECQKIILSDRAFAQIYNETQYRKIVETGGLLLGHYMNGIWYIVESSDPGYKGIYRHAYHESDEDYANHVCDIISRTYKYPLNFLGMWHRHPGSMDSFSGTDDNTNAKYAISAGNGCVSLLINLDPAFRITAYYVEASIGAIYYTKMDINVGDSFFQDSRVLTIASKSDIDSRIIDGSLNKR